MNISPLQGLNQLAKFTAINISLLTELRCFQFLKRFLLSEAPAARPTIFEPILDPNLRRLFLPSMSQLPIRQFHLQCFDRCRRFQRIHCWRRFP